MYFKLFFKKKYLRIVIEAAYPPGRLEWLPINTEQTANGLSIYLVSLILEQKSEN